MFLHFLTFSSKKKSNFEILFLAVLSIFTIEILRILEFEIGGLVFGHSRSLELILGSNGVILC